MGCAVCRISRKHRGEVHPASRCKTGTLLDGRDEWRNHRFSVHPQEIRNGVPASTYAGREKSSGPRIRHSFREPVHTVLTSGWLPEDYLIDRKPPSGGSTHLPESRFSTGPRGTATQLRARPSRRMVGVSVVIAKMTRVMRLSVVD